MLKKTTISGLLGLLVGLFLLGGILRPQALWAGGGASYPLGAEAFLVGAFPPPGFYMTNYSYFYTADELKDDHRDDNQVFDEISVWADVVRGIWISDYKILGGNYGQHFFLPLLNVDLDFKAPVGPKGRRSYSDTDVPYIIYSPFILGHHFFQGKLHTALSLVDIYIPTGQDDGNLASVGHNFWTFEPAVALTWMPGPFAFSLKVMYDFNTEQQDCATPYGFLVDRRPGDEFHFDFSASMALGGSWRLGLSGYFYQQVSDDDYDIEASLPVPVQDLLKADEENHASVWAVGPGVWYNYRNMFFSLRSQYEFRARNQAEGMNVWAKITYAF
ncbi:MAG: transporter [Deltaproteobacteria bacterium]|nr:transporter [Deltaproteobacteria bacterium]